MDLESLESFLEVEKHKNFTKAAESMFCTQAAVSMRIKRLETALECGLFKRCGRRVELTREGEIFLPYARQMVNTWKSASEHLLQTRLMEGKRDTDHLLQHTRNLHHTLADLPVPPVLSLHNSDQPHPVHPQRHIRCDWGKFLPGYYFPARLSGHGRALLRAADGGPPCAGSPSPAPVGGKKGDSL